MNLPRPFPEYLRDGIIRKTSPDNSRSSFLREESQNSYNGLIERIDKMGINDKNSNSIIKDGYDIIMEMIRAKLYKDGYSSSGSYSHEAEVSYLKVLNFNDSDVSFLNDLRYFRNSITYYGKKLDEEYARLVVSFTKRIFPILRNILDK
ncbi:hypothetical protein COU57_07035 [Candidatus Pacearchaeota archaeon CG10_big_fil_rev_8_21_14_0_10_32_14]|nr:MAG: hypothetical protein COU57_07035 [Candidatus Pacearchaeota archaeon CG10_big_fil_rev_8_21_14_0_10_32_14]